jgi:DNA-binding transcriptional MerR regulator
MSIGGGLDGIRDALGRIGVQLEEARAAADLAGEGDATALQALDGIVDELAREVAELKAQTTTGRF